MSKDKKAELDSENILMTLDQIGQTIDIMTSVVGRLRGYINQHLETDQTNSAESKTLNEFPDNHSQTVH